MPPQDSQGTECVPPARRPSLAFHVEVDLALMGLIEGPSSVLVSTPYHQVDGFVRPFIGLHARLSQVLQAPQDVVVPTRWKRESCPTRSRILPIALDDLSGGQRPEEAAFQQVLLPPKSSIPYGWWAALCLLVLKQSFEHADRGV